MSTTKLFDIKSHAYTQKNLRAEGGVRLVILMMIVGPQAKGDFDLRMNYAMNIFVLFIPSPFLFVLTIIIAS
jgi:hypothetical protein